MRAKTGADFIFSSSSAAGRKIHLSYLETTKQIDTEIA